MNNKNIINNQLKTAKGKRLLEKTLLEYSKEIIKVLEEQPEILPELLEILQISEEDFFEYLSGDKKANITLYDQTLCLVKKKTKITLEK